MSLKIFYSCSDSPKDEELRKELEKQLALLQREGLIEGWHRQLVTAGGDTDKEAEAHVRSAQIILLLISSDFFASNYQYGVEMKIALERQQREEAIVIPVLLRPADWSRAPFSHLKPLPSNHKAITEWGNEDAALADVAKGIRAVVFRFKTQAAGPSATSGQLVDQNQEQQRIVDAAIPSHVVKDRGTELLVLIRKPNSPGLAGVLQEDKDAEARPEDVKSEEFGIVFPLGPTGKPEAQRVEVKVTSPDFSPSERTKNILVPPDKDSDVCPFVLTPKKLGRLTVWVELQWEETFRGHQRVRTQCVADATEAPAKAEMNLVQMEVKVNVAEVNRAVGIDTGSGLMPAGALPAPTSAPSLPYHPAPSVPAAPSHLPPSAPDPAAPVDYYTAREWPEEGSERKSVGYPREYDAEAVEGGTRRGSDTATMARAPAAEGDKTWLRMPVQVVVAIIALIGTLTVGYWQFVVKPKAGTTLSNVVVSGEVLNARNGEFVQGALVRAVLEAGARPPEAYADSSGSFSIQLGEVKSGTQGKIYVQAKQFQAQERNFTVTATSVREEFRLEPTASGTATARPPGSVGSVAGRVVDAKTNEGIGHVRISFAGRTEYYLTEDNGNFRIQMTAPLPSEGVRLLVQKNGCVPLDHVVRPPVENLILELRCGN